MRYLRWFSIPLAIAASVLAVATAGAAVPVDPSCPVTVAPPQGSVRACSPGHLADVLNSEFRGRIVIPRDVVWEMKGDTGQPLRELPVKSGVEIVGERGALGSRPTLFARDISTGYPLLRVIGNDVRISGIRFLGPKPASTHDRIEPTVQAIQVFEDFDQQLGRRVLIDDNEFDEWSHAGVSVRGAHEVRHPKDWDPAWRKPVPAEAGAGAGRAQLHPPQRADGAATASSSEAAPTPPSRATSSTSTATRWRPTARRSAATSRASTTCCRAAIKQATTATTTSTSTCTASGRAGRATDGGPAGEYFEIAFNTIRGEQGYYGRPRRGPPSCCAARRGRARCFNGNVLVHDDLDAAVSLKQGGTSLGIGEDHAEFNFHAAGNRFDTDYSTEIATGDFDGDGRTDVFVANGTAWFFSRGGHAPVGTPAHRPTSATQELGFADIDNDGRHRRALPRRRRPARLS